MHNWGGDSSSDSDDGYGHGYGGHHTGENTGEPAYNLPDALQRYNEDDNTDLAVLLSLTSPLHTLKAVLQEVFYYTQRDKKEQNMYQSAARKVADLFVQHGIIEEAELEGDSENGIVQKIKKALLQNVQNGRDMMTKGNVDGNHQDPIIPKHIELGVKEKISSVFNATQSDLRQRYVGPCDASFIVQAMLVNAIIQGSAVYAASYGWQQLFLATISDPMVIAACHGLGATLVGLWLGSGRGISGIASGILVGATAFALHAYALPFAAHLLENIYPLSDLELQLVGGALTIMATMLWETLAAISSYSIDDELLELQIEGESLHFEYEFYMHHFILSGSLQVSDEDGQEERVR